MILRINLRSYVISALILLLMMGFNNSAHCYNSLKLSGVVLDAETRAPVKYANISIINSRQGTTSNRNGRFEISLENIKKSVLVFSHIGYIKNELVVTDTLLSKIITVYLNPKVSRLEEVIVSASLYKQQINKLSKSAAIISRRQIDDNMQSNMIDMLASNPAFTQVWEYHSPILLRGMNSKRLIIMKNGNRRIGTFPGGYFGQDMNIYDSKKIEIVKGPGSVIYGSGAISGIINIVNSEPFGDTGTNTRLSSGYGSNNNELLEVAKVCYKRENYGFIISGKYRHTNDYTYSDGKTAENSDLEDRDLSITSGYKSSDEHKFIFSANYHYGDWGKPRGFNGPANYFTKIRNVEERFHSALNYTYSPKLFVQTMKFNIYHDTGTRDYHKYKFNTVTGKLSVLDLVHYRDDYMGGQLFTTLNLSPDNKLTTGLDWYYFLLDNPTDLIDYYNDTKGTLEGYENAGQYDIGAFINDEWNLSSNIRLIAGIRYDEAAVHEGEHGGIDERIENRTAFSGNAGLVFSPKEKLYLSLNLGRAFRMPTAEELFTEVISCKGIKLGNPDLKPEYGWNLDFGFRGIGMENKLQWDFALFYNRLYDFINETLDTEHDDIDFTYKNTDAKIMGGELSMSYRINGVIRPSNNLFVGLGTSYVYGVDLFSDKDDAPLFGIPPWKVTGNLKYHGLVNRNWVTGYYFKLEIEYAAEQNRIAEIPAGAPAGPWGYISSEAHTVFNANVGLNSNSLPGFPKLRLAVKNVFGADYKPFGSYVPAMGTNYKIVVSFNL
ncbi:MAG: TonB-dependent receptor [Candidatus Hatepunaea meridiana]|nr:TonB-dependent receptor [Candidatus Hatepunaea meridiana]